MTLSIAAIAGPVPASPLRAAASTSVFALSLAQSAGAPVAGVPIAGAQVAGKDDDPPPGDADGCDDTRQDDAVGGNALPLAAATPVDPAQLAAWMMPALPPVSAPPAPKPVETGPSSPAGATMVAVTPTIAATPPTFPVSATSSVPSLVSSTTLPALPVDPIAAPVRLTAAPMAAAPLPDPSGAAIDPTAGVPVAPSSPTTMAASILPAVLAASPRVTAGSVPLPITPSAIVALAAPVSLKGVTITAVQAPAAADISVPSVPDPAPGATAMQIDTRAAPVVALPPAQAPAPPLPGAMPAATTTSAIQAFGTAMRAGLAKEMRTELTDPAVPLVGTTAHTAATPAVAATGDVQQAPLDLRRETWPHAMIDRIEALRDAADATSTKMRVVPDALGPIEMSVRKDGDTVHVHFTAEQAQTRTLLTDAQPRLVAIAEQRGLRLGGSTVDVGAGGAGQQQQQATARQPVARPSPTVTADTAADDDTRLA